jgi:hypothetical protein
LRTDRDEEDIDWIVIKATESKFTGYGGTMNLKELLTYAVEWLDDNPCG